MKRLPVILLAALTALFSASEAGAAAASVAESDVLPDSIPSDSLSLRVATFSDNNEEQSLIKDLIPPTPQAAALARYGEHPVNHSTGIPDISIPIYEINLGGYTLPISLSYHASGFRPDDVAPPVGLGWSLQAGGLISRSIMGVPDFERIGDQLTMLRDPDRFKAEIAKKRYSFIDEVTDRGIESIWDTETDRYTYNFNGHSGVFRYCDSDDSYIPLNHEPLTILSWNEGVNSGRGGVFCLIDGEYNEFYFEQPEFSGVSDDEGHSKISSWYLTKICAHNDTIKLKYHLAPKYEMRRASAICDFGERFNPDYDEYAISQIGNDFIMFYMKESLSHTNYVYEEVRLESITWPDGRVEFTYQKDSPFHTSMNYTVQLERLTEIKVMNLDGTVRKSVTLDNDHYWGCTKQNRRMMLHSVTDSEAGTFQFDYNIPTNLTPENAYATCGTDFWGYYNGSEKKPYSHKIAREARLRAVKQLWTQDNRYDNLCDGADRKSNEDCMKLGIIKSITYPTGASSYFEFEANRAEYPYENTKSILGGLRLKSISTGGAGADYTRKSYTYSGSAVYARPEHWMVHESYFPDQAALGWGLSNQVFRHMTIVSNPRYPSAGGFGCPVFYYNVTETTDDGSSTDYTYYPAEIAAEDRYADNFDNNMAPPEVFRAALYDEGNCTPNLHFMRKYDSAGNLLYEESYKYQNKRLKEFITGTRVIKALDLKFNDGYVFTQRIEGFLRPPYFYIYPVKAIVKSFQTTKKTVRDHTTGMVQESEMSYDEAMRTLRPRAVISLCSDGLRDTTRYEFAFDHAGSSDPVLREMSEYYPEAVTAIDKFHGPQRVSSVRYGFDSPSMFPDRLSTAIGDSPIKERERVLSRYGMMPETVVVNGCDTTRYEWEGFYHLRSVTAPGGLVTRYTSLPLFGLTSVTDPRGHRTDYSYKSDGRLGGISDCEGTIATFDYNIRSREGDDHENSVVTTTRLDSSGSAARRSRQYCDGLGRPWLTASLGENTSGKWVYTMTLYDCLGREWKSYLPSVGTSTVRESEISDLAAATYADSAACTVTHYDGLSRPSFVETPGALWREAGKGKTYSYGTNGTDDVRRYTAPLENTSLVKSGYYAPGTLSSECVTDEDGMSLTVFTDLNGRKVLERRGKGNDTYYVYNSLGQLRFVLQPEYQNAGYRSEYAFEYRYDSRGRLVKKILPGCEAERYWYDRAGRLIFYQDANLLARGEHRFMLYDRAGRLAVQGVCTSCDRGEAPNPVRLTPGLTGGIASTGYEPLDPSRISGVTLETVNYYDDHAFTCLHPEVAAVPEVSASARGLLTGSLSLSSAGDTIVTALHYTPRGEISTSIMRRASETLTTRFTYTFTGEVASTEQISTAGPELTLVNGFDPSSGLPESLHVYAGRSQRVSTLVYDDLGRVTANSRGGLAGTVETAYNLHGSVTSITSPAFSQQLFYADTPGTPCWNGNVSAMTWSSPDYLGGRLCGYSYTYDTLNRLTEAVYGETERISSNPNRYTERVLDYTANGAMKRMQRHGLKDDGVYGKIDNLHIYLNGNRIGSVTDDARPVTRAGATDFNQGADSRMLYNGCGALIADGNRGIARIDYDRFNRPVRAQFTDGNLTEWVYGPDGTKLRTIHTTVADGVTVPMNSSFEITPDMVLHSDTTDYCGPFVYENRRLVRVLYPGGFVAFNESGASAFNYFTADHVGNIRAVTDEYGNVMQRTDYYPFGGIIADRGFGRDMQPYKTAGKETDMMHGLSAVDFGARLYTPMLPQWDRMDPKADDYRHINPYSFCENNPVNIMDPNGKSTRVKRLDDGTYEVIGGALDDDRNIYLYSQDKNGDYTIKGQSIGITTSVTSFYNSDNNEGWMTGSIIDPADNSGIKFLNRIFKSNMTLIPYMINARNYQPLDFKSTNGVAGTEYDKEQYYRGMPVGVGSDGQTMYSSARDIGNIAAGYVAATNGLSWGTARLGFDAYQSYTSSGNNPTEGISTKNAERYGWEIGAKKSNFIKTFNLIRSIYIEKFPFKFIQDFNSASK